MELASGEGNNIDESLGEHIPTVTLFNFKGGVSKTTTTYNLSWCLAELNLRVLMVDADPQCNLSQTFTVQYTEEQLTNLFEISPDGTNNVGSSLSLVLTARSMTPAAVTSLKHPYCPNLYLAPGSPELIDYEQAVSSAEISKQKAVSHIPGAFYAMVQKTARECNADVVVIDTNPSMGPLNMLIVSFSDYFIIPCQADFYSNMAVKSIAKKFFQSDEAWNKRGEELRNFVSKAKNTLPNIHAKLLGYIVQNYTIQNAEPAAAFQYWIEKLKHQMKAEIIPEFTNHNMAANVSSYHLGSIQNFNRFAPMAQSFGVPVVGLRSNSKFIVNPQREPLTGNQRTKALEDLKKMTKPLKQIAKIVREIIVNDANSSSKRKNDKEMQKDRKNEKKSKKQRKA